MTDRTDERSATVHETAREPISPKALVDLVARLESLCELAEEGIRRRFGRIEASWVRSILDALAAQRRDIELYRDRANRFADGINELGSKLTAAEAEVAGLKARVAEVLEPFAECATHPDNVDAPIDIAVEWIESSQDLTLGHFRRAAELHAAMRGEGK